MVLENLTPSRVWEIFENIFCATPRESGQEGAVREKVKDYISKQNISGISLHEDNMGNLLIRKQALPGFEKKPVLMLQGHLDVVCESNLVEGFDFKHLPIPVKISKDKKWVTADGTTLGADNGIGCSIALAVMIADDLKHGPIELLLTVSEETGLDGAFGLEVGKLAIQSTRMISIDSEDLGVITIGSAGGGEIKITHNLEKSNLIKKIDDDLILVEISVSGLKGGHSGVDIHLPRANAIKLIGRIAGKISDEIQIHLCSWNGGKRHNSIPREANVRFAINRYELERVRDIVETQRKEILAYYNQIDNFNNKLEPDLKINMKQIGDSWNLALNEVFSKKIISFVRILPHGPINFSPSIPNLVETSFNLAIININLKENLFRINASVRSSINTELEELRASVKDLAFQFGFEVTLNPAYPGWNPDPNSSFLEYVRKLYSCVVEGDIKIAAVHAGLECGIIASKIPKLEGNVVAIGPTIHGAHTPSEKVRIHDVSVLYDLIKKIIEEMSDID